MIDHRPIPHENRETPAGFVMWSEDVDGPGYISPIPFYEHYGFVQTGDIVCDDDVLLELPLGA
ncbi:MAG TPA: hypothetical protein VH459_09585 [Gaiellales bacterium]|jgi:hypothetical protein